MTHNMNVADGINIYFVQIELESHMLKIYLNKIYNPLYSTQEINIEYWEQKKYTNY
jgi:hypothetical protein